MKQTILSIFALLLIGCGSENKATFASATGCSVSQTATGTVLTCPDGSSSTISNGEQGPKGDQGAMGTQGPVGPQGTTGIQGTTGPQGPAGLQGPKGNTGAQGPMGLSGTSGVNGLNFLSGASNPVGTLGLNNETYLNAATGDLFKKISGAWSYLGSLKGPQGNTGAQGPKGDKGDQGPAGAGPTLKIYSNIPQGQCYPLGATGIYVYHSGEYVWFKRYSNCSHGNNDEGVYCPRVAQMVGTMTITTTTAEETTIESLAQPSAG